MKKILIILTVLAAGVWAISFGGHCKFEGEKTHEVAKPIVEALAVYAKEHGRPQSIADVKGIPYPLKPCTDKADVKECDVYADYKDAHYFQIQDEHYAVIVYGWSGPVSKNDFGFKIVHNDTRCRYSILKNEKVVDNTSVSYDRRCGLLGSCKAWGKQ